MSCIVPITRPAGVVGVGLLVVSCSLLGGCPLGGDSSNSGPVAQITISATQGDPPLRVTASAENSTSAGSSIVKYSWDFAGEASSDEMVASHTFYTPGRYPVTLTVFDADGRQSRARATVLVHGGEVTALIGADSLSGAAPLTVQFDSADSTAVDDTIRDYYWDFGDGGTSREAAPVYTFDQAGSFVVTLRVVSAGGVEGVTQTEVQVFGTIAGASLQFSGTQFANLPVAPAGPLTDFTFQAWCKPDAVGGTLVNFGVPSVAIDVLPATGQLSLRTSASTTNLAASVPANTWRHVAVSYTAGAGAFVYVDGAPIGAAPLDGEFGATLLSLGAGFSGKIAQVQFWGTARSATQIAANIWPSGFEDGLLGAWALDEGAGQTLSNTAVSGAAGVLGSSTAVEAGDPAWSSDAP